MKLHSLFLAGAAALTVGAYAVNAKADTIYTTTPTTVTTTTQGHEVTHESYTAVGTRKVGLVGYHPYPMVASHAETNTVRTSAPETVTYTTAPGVVVTNPNGRIASSSTVVTSTNDAPIAYSTGGGQYYTEDGTPYYSNPNLNVNVRSTGSFND